MEEKKKHCHCGEEECTCDEETCTCDEGDCDCDCEEDEIVELIADDGRKLKFYFIGTIDYNDKEYAAFEPAEEIDGVEMDSLVIFELVGDTEEDAELLPVKDEKLLEEVYNAFVEACDDEEDA